MLIALFLILGFLFWIYLGAVVCQVIGKLGVTYGWCIDDREGLQIIGSVLAPITIIVIAVYYLWLFCIKTSKNIVSKIIDNIDKVR